MGMMNRVPEFDLLNLRDGKMPPGMPLYDTDHIYDLCKRWASLSQWQRERLLIEVRPLIIDKEERQAIVGLLAGKYITQLADPIQGYRRLGNEQIRKIWENLRVTAVTT